MALRGVYTAIVTPFAETGFGIHEDQFKKLIELQIEAGIDGIVIAGSTGEGQTLTEAEWEQAAKIALQYRDKIQVMLSCGSSATWDACNKVKKATDWGVHSVLVSNPPYNKPTQEGLIRHFEEVAKAASSTPVMLYNIPGRTAVNLSAESLQKLWEIDNIVAIKESSGDWSQFLQMIHSCPANKAVFCGDDPLINAFALHGAKGCVSVMSNVIPHAVTRLWSLCEGGDWAEATSLFKKLSPVMKLLFTESNPIPVKWASGELIRSSLEPRLPLLPLSGQYHEDLSKAVSEARSLGT